MPSSREFCGENEDRLETVKKKEFILQKIKKTLSENNATVRANMEMRGSILPSKGSSNEKRASSITKKGRIKISKSKKRMHPPGGPL